MPKIINAYEAGNGSIADSLKSMGESIWGDEAKNEGLRQHALKLQRENQSAVPFANAAAANDPAQLRYYGAVSGRHGNDVANWNLLSAADRAGANLDDPRLGVAQIGAGHPATATMEDQNRQRANARAMEEDRTDKFVPVMGEDQYGGKTPVGAFRSRTGEMKKFAPNGGFLPQPQPNAAAGFRTVAEDDHQPYYGGTGEDGNQNPLVGGGEYLRTLPPGRAAIVAGILDGRMPPPTGNAALHPRNQRLLEDAARVEPDFDLTKWGMRFQSEKAFQPGGKYGNSIKSLNQAVTHAGTLMEEADALHNHENIGKGIPLVGPVVGLGTQALNSGKNAVANASGEVGTGRFDLARNAFADEIASVFRTVGMSDHQIKMWQDTINSSQSPTQLRANVGAAVELYQGAANALEGERNRGGMSPLRKREPMINQQTQDTLGRIGRWAAGGKLEKAPFKVQGQHPAGAPQPVVTPQSQAGPGPQGQFNDRFGGAQADPGAALLAEARDAIARGAPRDAVIQHLQQLGVAPAGL